METLHVFTRAEWRSWLRENFSNRREIWLVYYKKNTGRPRISYEDAVEEALCFGWIDSIVRKIDEERYAQKFTPRTNAAKWSTTNIARMKKLIRAGRMTRIGLSKIEPRLLSGRPPAAKPAIAVGIPPSVRNAFRQNPAAWSNFRALAPSYRRMYILWILAAKKDETRKRRLQEALSLLEKNKKLGLK